MLHIHQSLYHRHYIVSLLISSFNKEETSIYVAQKSVCARELFHRALWRYGMRFDFVWDNSVKLQDAIAGLCAYKVGLGKISCVFFTNLFNYFGSAAILQSPTWLDRRQRFVYCIWFILKMFWLYILPRGSLSFVKLVENISFRAIA
jgi:hypothetical protein